MGLFSQAFETLLCFSSSSGTRLRLLFTFKSLSLLLNGLRLLSASPSMFHAEPSRAAEAALLELAATVGVCNEAPGLQLLSTLQTR